MAKASQGKSTPTSQLAAITAYFESIQIPESDHPTTQVLKNLKKGFIDLCNYVASRQEEPTNTTKDEETGE